MTDYGTRLRCFDNGGKTFDRYTIVPPRWAKAYLQPTTREWDCIAASENPFHPMGFGQHCVAVPGRHLGKRVHWASLPSDVQKFARQSFPEFCEE